jgi:tetratricopeptide (TPR) repeat protein
MVGHLFLTEVYLDRAREAWRALQVQAAATENYDVTETVQPGQAALPRPIEHNYRGADYDFMSAISGTNDLGDAIISFTLDTKRARSEVHAESAPRELVQNLLGIGWNEGQSTQDVGHTLFKLLIPIEMESFLSGSSEMQIELDSGTAGIPWELLDTGGDGGGANPWAIRTKLLRKLRTADFRLNPRDASASDGILIVGEPECDPKIYPPLPGARKEAVAVRDLFLESRKVSKESIVSLIHPEAQDQPGFDACKIISTVISGDWRIVHIAGHGEPPAKIGPIPQKPGDPPQRDGRPRGVVLSDGLFLGPDLIQKMRPVPELVFVNCCHLAARNPGQLLRTDESLLGKPYDRASFASGVAEELIKLGVRCVIAAGWAVGDEQAMAFATTFYNQILGGDRFLDAVDAARQESRKKGGNTWAAYQCYGDPDWRFRTSPGAHASAKRPKDEFAGIASPQDLVVALKTLAVESEFRKAPQEQQLKRVTYLRDRFAAIWNRNGEVAEAFGKAFAVLKQSDDAIDWYGRALAASDGSASIKAAEQLGNLRVRLVYQKLNSNGGRADAIEKARVEINDARTSLEFLANDAKTSVERQNLCGSAWKRIALVERLAEQPQQESEAIQKMYERYLTAEKLAREANADDVFYPALNRVAATILINCQKADWTGLDPNELKELREQIHSKLKNDPDFWSTVGLVELELYEALAQRELAAKLDKLKTGFNEAHSRASSLWMWSSVYDQAQFVLNGYFRNLEQPLEKDASDQILALLERMATGK